MANENIIETVAAEQTANEIIESSTNCKTLKTLGIAGGVVLVAGLSYQFIAKPVIKKIKDAKAAKMIKAEAPVDIEEDEFEEQ